MDSAELYREFEKIYFQYIKAIFRFVNFRITDSQLAQDITQDVFLRFWKILSSGQKVRNEKALLYFIAHGFIVNAYRRRERKPQASLDSVPENLVVTGNDAEDEIDKHRQLREIISKLQEIKEEYRNVLLLYYAEDMDVSDIALILQKNDNTIRVLIHRALKALKGKL